MQTYNLFLLFEVGVTLFQMLIMAAVYAEMDAGCSSAAPLPSHLLPSHSLPRPVTVQIPVTTATPVRKTRRFIGWFMQRLFTLLALCTQIKAVKHCTVR